jgi:hypothetical protein
VSPITRNCRRGDADDPVSSGRPATFFQRSAASSSVVVDGDQQLVLVDAEILGEQLPGELDRVLLEIVAEGEIAEHLEERVMPRGVADIVEVVVLAARRARISAR